MDLSSRVVIFQRCRIHVLRHSNLRQYQYTSLFKSIKKLVLITHKAYTKYRAHHQYCLAIKALRVNTNVTNCCIVFHIRDCPGTYPVLCAYSIFCQKKDFSHFSEKDSLFMANNIVISINNYNFFFKILVFVKIKNKHTKPDMSQCNKGGEVYRTRTSS